MTLAVIPKSASTEIRISRSDYKGEKYVDIRVYYKTEEGEMAPTKKGISVKLEEWAAFVEIIKGIKAEG